MNINLRHYKFKTKEYKYKIILIDQSPQKKFSLMNVDWLILILWNFLKAVTHLSSLSYKTIL